MQRRKVSLCRYNIYWHFKGGISSEIKSATPARKRNTILKMSPFSMKQVTSSALTVLVKLAEAHTEIIMALLLELAEFSLYEVTEAPSEVA